MGNVNFYLFVQWKNTLRIYKSFLRERVRLRNIIDTTLSINSTGMFTYKASPMHCINQYRIELMLSHIINNRAILFSFFSLPPKHRPTVAERSSVNHCLKFSHQNEGESMWFPCLCWNALGTAKPTQPGMNHLQGLIKYFWKAWVLPLECTGLHQEFVML